MVVGVCWVAFSLQPFLDIWGSDWVALIYWSCAIGISIDCGGESDTGGNCSVA